MMQVIWIIGLVAATLIVYFLAVRPYLRSLSFYDRVHEYSDTAWKAVLARLLGLKVIVTGLFAIVITELPDILQQLSVIDYAPFLGDDIGKKVAQGAILLMVFFRTFSPPPPPVPPVPPVEK